MATVTRTFTVAQDRATVVANMRDFANATTWDPGSVSNVQVTEGPIERGTVWHNTSKLLGIITAELDYTLIVDEPDHLVFVGKNTGSTATDDLRFRDAGAARTKIVYRASIEMNGVMKLAEPLMWLIFQRIAAETVSSITSYADNLR